MPTPNIASIRARARAVLKHAEVPYATSRSAGHTAGRGRAPRRGVLSGRGRDRPVAGGGVVTPAERIRLAEALSAATGAPWAPGMGLGYDVAPALEGATRRSGVPISIYRAGHEGWLVAGQFGARRHRFPGAFSGRGWFDRFMPAALAMIESFDKGFLDYAVRAERVDAKRARLHDHYRRMLAPGSGCTDAEREQARRRLGLA